MFREATNKGPPNGPIYIDDYFVDHETEDPIEENLFLAANQLIAKRYTDTGIFEHTYQENLEWLIRDFGSRSPYLTYVIFERTKDWDWINPLGTLSIFMDENNLPAFDQMPAESIDVLYKAIENDIDALGVEYESFNTPGLMELGRLAIEGEHGLNMVNILMGAALDCADLAPLSSYSPSHLILCCKGIHSRIHEQAYGFIPVDGTKSTVYNGKVGLFMYNNMLKLRERSHGKKIDVANACMPDVLSSAGLQQYPKTPSGLLEKQLFNYKDSKAHLQNCTK